MNSYHIGLIVLILFNILVAPALDSLLGFSSKSILRSAAHKTMHNAIGGLAVYCIMRLLHPY